MTRTRDKEKSESPAGIEPMTSRTPGVKDEVFNITREWEKEKSDSPTGIEPI